MADPKTIINSISSNLVNLVNSAELARQFNDQIAQDPTLITRYFATTGDPPVQYGDRKDITQSDVQNMLATVTLLLAAYDSGSPPAKSYLYRMLP